MVKTHGFSHGFRWRFSHQHPWAVEDLMGTGGYPAEIKDSHRCVENAMRRNCPVCLQATGTDRETLRWYGGTLGGTLCGYPVIIDLVEFLVDFLFTWCFFLEVVIMVTPSCSTRSSWLFYRIQHANPAKLRGSEFWLVVEVSLIITVRHRESGVFGGSLPVCDPSHHTSVRTHHSPGPSRIQSSRSRSKTCQHNVP